jgi:hypothetical protein
MIVLATLLVWCNPSLVTASNHHLRSSSNSNSNSNSNINHGNSDNDNDDDYKKLMDCMFKGTDPAICHQMDCYWCRSKLFSLCVTSDTAVNIGGTVFQCEDPPPAPDDNDDDAATKPPCPCNDDCNGKDDDNNNNDDDDDAPRPPTNPPAPEDDDAAPPTTDDAKALDDFWYLDDAVPPPATDDATPPPPPPPATDDGEGPEDEKYMIDLLKCMQHSRDGCGTVANETDCVWCGNAKAFSMGLCLSDAAAKNMEGVVYTCEWPAVTPHDELEQEPLPFISNSHHEHVASNDCTFFEEDDCQHHCQWCHLDLLGGICLETGVQFDMLDQLAQCGNTMTPLE